MFSSDYYNKNAAAYIADTFNADMSSIRGRFISYLPEHGAVLDAGCGSGRDAKAFSELGFDVYALDASAAMVEHCRSIIGDRCVLSTFREYNPGIKFDGIWACASFLHLEPPEFGDVIMKFTGFLKPGGVFFMSFKYGRENYVKDGRYFNCHTDESIEELLSSFKNIEILQNFITGDVRAGRSGEKWVNVIVRRRPPA